MARPRSNEKVIKYLEDSRSDVVCRIADAVLTEDYTSATILKAWKVCLNTTLDMIKGGADGSGKRNKAAGKLPE